MTCDVTIVIPVWNQADLLQKLLDSIRSQTSQPTSVVVVDNDSTDGAPAIATEWGAALISMHQNVGFAAAVNRGIQASSSRWIALVNTDVELDPDWLRLLVAASEDEGAWLGSGKILMAHQPSRIDGTFDLLARSGCAWRAGHGESDRPEFRKACLTSLIPATAAIYRRDLFERIGYFAEIYESYLEDVDLALRAAALGFSAIYVPDALCKHHGSASAGGKWSNRVVRLLARNQIILVRRLLPSDLRQEWRWEIFIGQWLWGLVALRHGRWRAWITGRIEGKQCAVDSIPLDPTALRCLISESQRQIRRMQQKSRGDLYWRLYFLFTGSESG